MHGLNLVVVLVFLIDVILGEGCCRSETNETTAPLFAAENRWTW